MSILLHLIFNTDCSADAEHDVKLVAAVNNLQVHNCHVTSSRFRPAMLFLLHLLRDQRRGDEPVTYGVAVGFAQMVFVADIGAPKARGTGLAAEDLARHVSKSHRQRGAALQFAPET